MPHYLLPIVLNQLVKMKMILMINHKTMVLNNTVMDFGIQMFSYASMYALWMDTLDVNLSCAIECFVWLYLRPM